MTRWGWRLGSLLLLTVLIGCTSQEAKRTQDAENSHLRWLLRLYALASNEAQGRPPKSEEAFKQYIAGMDAGVRDRLLAGAGVSSTDELFISERDGQPYVIIYGKPARKMDSGVVAYEQQGVNGLRYVGRRVGAGEEVDEQQFNTMVPPEAWK